MSNEENPVLLQKKGDECLKTSCCKSKPDYNEALILFRDASDLYHGEKNWKEEIRCRYKLANCFKQTKSYWEEGKEYEKISKIRINQLNSNNDDIMIDINNAFQSFCAEKEYNSAMKCIFNLSKEFIQKENYVYAEKCSKIGFDNLKKFYHVIILNKNKESIDYLYDGIRQYLDILIYNEEINSAKNVIDNILEMINEEDSENKEEISKFNIFKLGIFILEDDKINFEKVSNSCEQNKNWKSIIQLKRAIDNFDDKNFKDAMFDINYIFPNSMIKRINQLYKNIKNNKEKKIEPEDVELDFK
jgi:hypothetical protein